MSRATKRILTAALAVALIAAAAFAAITAKSVGVSADTVRVFEMRYGASIRFEQPAGLRFAADVDATTKNEVLTDETKCFGALIVPEDYFGLYGVSKTGDVLANFAQKGATVITKDNLTVAENETDGKYAVACSITDVLYTNLNRNFFGLIYIKTVSGGGTDYEYASIAESGSNVRNITFVANSALNSPDENLNATKRALLERQVINGYLMSEYGGEITGASALEALADGTDYDVLKDYYVLGGYASCKIVLPQAADEYELYAAERLKDVIGEFCGTEPTVYRDNEVTYSADGKCIYIGDVIQKAANGVTAGATGAQGYAVKSLGNNLFIFGEEGRSGVINGANAFLKDYFSYEAFTDDVYTLGELSNVPFTAKNVTATPSVKNYMQTSVSKENRLNFGICDYSDVFNGSALPYHNSFGYVPPSEYGAEHPDWFADSLGQICYTAHGDSEEYAALTDEVYGKMKAEYLRAKSNGEGEVNLAFTTQDNGVWCDCESCLQHISRYSAKSAAVVAFCNALSNRFAADSITDANVYFFAYMDTVTAPTGITCNANVIPIIAPITAEISRETAFTANGVSALVTDWQNASADGRFALWTYSANYQNYFAPYNPFGCMSANFLYVSGKSGLTFWYDEHQSQPSSAAVGFADFKYYLQSKLAFDADFLTENTLISVRDRFFDAYYGAASGDMKAYYDSYVSTLNGLRRNYNYTFTDKPNFYDLYSGDVMHMGTPFFQKSVLNSWKNYTDGAKSAISSLQSTNPTEYAVLLNRVTKESAAVEFMLLKLYGSDYSASDYAVLKSTLLNDCAAAKITRWRENENVVNAFYSSNARSSTISDLIVLVDSTENVTDPAALAQRTEAFGKIYEALNFSTVYNEFTYADRRLIAQYADKFNGYANVISFKGAYLPVNGIVNKSQFDKCWNYSARYDLDTEYNAFYGKLLTYKITDGGANKHAAAYYRFDDGLITRIRNECGLIKFKVYNGSNADASLVTSFGGETKVIYPNGIKANDWTEVTVSVSDFFEPHSVYNYCYFGIMDAVTGATYKFSPIYAVKNIALNLNDYGNTVTDIY